MNAIVRKRPLNCAFKRFQLLPELPKIQIADSAAVQLFEEGRPLNNEAKHSRGANEAQFTQVLTADFGPGLLSLIVSDQTRNIEELVQ